MDHDVDIPDCFRDRRVLHFPLVLPDGRWNVAPVDQWLDDAINEPGPPSGRPPLSLGDATRGDLDAYRAMLKQVVVEAQRAVTETRDLIRRVTAAPNN